MSGNAMPNSVQQPLFAPATQGSTLGDDIDLNEIFADYFISEFDDPLNAYTSSMANYSGAAAAVALAQKQQQVDAAAATSTTPAASLALPGVAITAPTPQTKPAPTPAPIAAPTPSGNSLPTGGIKTAFHSGVAQQQQQQQQHYHQNGNLTGEPATKRLKESVSPAGAPLYATAPVGPATAAAGLAPATNAPISKGAISGRLGFSVVAGQIKQAQPMTVARQPAAATGVALPVGVGIRLGGVGGVAPATAQLGPRGLHAPWGINSAGALSDKAVAERRQRNREHAKRSRVRKKFMLESLQGQVRELQKENLELRMLIQEKIPQHAQQIISECCGKNSLFADPDAIMTDADGEKKKETALVKSDFSLIESLTSGQQNFVLSDPRLPDNPIVYASPGFYDLTGYTQDQVLGRNCRFLQGPGTDPRAVDIIRKAIANGSDSTTCILNYKADGTPFWNQFFVAALRDSDNCIVNYVGVQCEVEPEAGSSALEDKVNSVLPLQQKEGEEGM